MMLAILTLSSCTKKSNVTPSATGISLLAGNWATNEWGVTNNTLIFTIDKTCPPKGTVDAISFV